MNYNDDDMKEIMKKLYEDAVSYNDPHELEYIKRQIKKNIPFGKRLNFAAYLFSQNNGSMTKKKFTPKSVGKNDITLYVNIGKMGNVHRKVLINFITENSTIGHEDISNLRMHDRYSFITLDKAKANKLVADLTGKEFRKRNVVINPAKDNN